MSLHKQPATQTYYDAHNVRYDEYSYNTFIAMPPISQQDPGHNAIKPGRRERVADPARDLVRRQRAVEAARAGHVPAGADALFVDRYAPLPDAAAGHKFEGCATALPRAADQLWRIAGVRNRSGTSAVVTRCLFWAAAHSCSC